MKKVFVYVDGFNLYHGIDDLKDDKLKWLDLWKLAESFCKEGEKVAKVYYFSAYATWKPDAYKRHRAYVKAISARGVTAVIGNFKDKPKKCLNCTAQWIEHEEKETDVHIAVQMITDAAHKHYDHAILITGDSDQAPTVNRARMLHPEAQLSVWTPPYRNKGCDSLGARQEIRKIRLMHARLPEQILAEDGSLVVECPSKYR